MALECAFDAGGAPKTPRAAILALIADEAAKAGVGVDELLGLARQRSIVRARYAAMREVHRAYPGKSYPELARIFRRDHTTVMYALGALKKKPKI